jgi:hypothetical protein
MKTKSESRMKKIYIKVAYTLIFVIRKLLETGAGVWPQKRTGSCAAQLNGKTPRAYIV